MKVVEAVTGLSGELSTMFSVASLDESTSMVALDIIN
jgi:hypothetical protein